MEPSPSAEERRTLELLIRTIDTRNAEPASTAKALLSEFGSFASVLNGTASRLRRAGADEAIISALSWCRAAVSICLRAPVLERPIIGSSSALDAYLSFQMGFDTRERVRVLYLDVKHTLLADEEIAAGSIDAAPFYNREIIGRAIELGSTSIIVVHNHPSGDPCPSLQDVNVTRRLSALCSELSIDFVDHIIVGRGRTLSLRQAGHLGS